MDWDKFKIEETNRKKEKQYNEFIEKGNKVQEDENHEEIKKILVSLDQKTLKRIKQAVKKPDTRTSWIRQAIQEKLDRK